MYLLWRYAYLFEYGITFASYMNAVRRYVLSGKKVESDNSLEEEWILVRDAKAVKPEEK